MILYEFITPSDPITFYAPDDDVALAVGIIIGSGKAGVTNTETGKSLPSLLLFLADLEARKAIEIPVATWEARKAECIVAAHSFAVCDKGERAIYDEFTENGQNGIQVAKWDDAHRSSMSDWCAYARSLKPAEAECKA